jgi:DNA-binding transcriptional regulator LsrR (DeoR family)
MFSYDPELLITVANLYYMEYLTQKEIADKLGISRIAVTRLLKRARESGMVQITVKQPLPELYALALQLERRLDLRTVRLAETASTEDETLRSMGKAGAELLLSLISPTKRIGAAWSRTVSAILPFIRRPTKPPLCINELAGTYLKPSIPFGVSWGLAERLAAPLETIPAPVLVSSVEIKNSILSERSIADAIEHAASVNIAFVGLGTIGEGSSLSKAGFIHQGEIDELKAKGAVGDILMRYYDRDGNHIPMSFDDRVIAIDWKSIRSIPMVIAMAFGENKVEIIRAAAKGGIIKGLVTDRATASILLEELD